MEVGVAREKENGPGESLVVLFEMFSDDRDFWYPLAATFTDDFPNLFPETKANKGLTLPVLYSAEEEVAVRGDMSQACGVTSPLKLNALLE